MDRMLPKAATTLILLVVLMLTACGGRLTSDDQARINERIRAVVERTFPLPESATIQTHVGNDLRFTTDLSVDKAVAFYREAYTAQGLIEQAGSQVSAESATLRFTKDDDYDAVLNVSAQDNGSDVHLWLEGR